MRLLCGLLITACAWASLADDVQALVARKQLALAVQLVHAAQAKQGANPELAASISWLARGALAERQFAEADGYATEARTMSLRVLGIRNIDSDPWLPTAI